MDRIGLQYTQTGEKVQIITAFGNIGASTADGTLTISGGGTLAGVTGRRWVILAANAICGATDTTVTLKSKGSGAGTAISSAKALSANGGWACARGASTDFLYATNPGEALTVGTGSGSTVGCDFTLALI